MKTIYKFPLKVTNETQVLEIPDGFTPLALQLQNGWPTFWALVDDAHPSREVKVTMYGTGWELHNTELYLGTIQMGAFVWHYFGEYI